MLTNMLWKQVCLSHEETISCSMDEKYVNDGRETYQRHETHVENATDYRYFLLWFKICHIESRSTKALNVTNYLQWNLVVDFQIREWFPGVSENKIEISTIQVILILFLKKNRICDYSYVQSLSKSQAEAINNDIFEYFQIYLCRKWMGLLTVCTSFIFCVRWSPELL